MNDIMQLAPKTHTLKNGTVLSWISAHGYKFNDGTRTQGAQVTDVVNAFTLTRQTKKVSQVNGMDVIEVSMVMTPEQQKLLQDFCELVDIVIVPFPMLVALREQGVRHLFPKCLAFNATPETQRAAPSEKIVDINQWSW